MFWSGTMIVSVLKVEICDSDHKNACNSFLRMMLFSHRGESFMYLVEVTPSRRCLTSAFDIL